MKLFHRLQLVHFRNYRNAVFPFSARIVAICGANGSGKTNLLDAVYYLCFTKSYFSRPDAQNVTEGCSGFRLDGRIEAEDGQLHDITCILRENNKKELQVDGEVYKKFSSHIGRFPCVMIAPDDVELITGGSEARRRMADAILCQLDAAYLQDLIAYNKILAQRNGFLKNLLPGSKPNLSLLDILDHQLSEPGDRIYEGRKLFFREYIPMVADLYEKIAEKKDAINLRYVSPLAAGNMELLLQRNRERDMLLQRTGTGIHKDDLEITMGGYSFKTMASQGQRKSLLFALRLSEYDILQRHKKHAPILLLDDVFEKLDAARMHNLLEMVCVGNTGPVFITDTHKERLSSAFEEMKVPFQLIDLEERAE